MITKDQALEFAADWVACWNAHDLERILAHYTEDFEMSSPVIADLMNEPSGTLRGKETVRAYWAKALARQPHLRFELIDVFTGANSVVVHYRGPRGLGAEIFWLDDSGKVFRAAAHYSATPPRREGPD